MASRHHYRDRERASHVINQPRFKNDVYFPEQDKSRLDQNDSSTAYDTNGPTPMMRHRVQQYGAGGPSPGLVLGGGGGGGIGGIASSAVGANAAVLGGVPKGVGGNGSLLLGDSLPLSGVKDGGSVGGAGGNSGVGIAAAGDDSFTPSTCMALGGRNDDLLFFEAGLQEYFYRCNLTTAILRIIIALATTILVVCLVHNVIYYGFATARFLVDESIVTALAPLEHHPILVFTRWISFSWAGILSFVVLVTAATAKRSAKLQHPEVLSARVNQLFLGPQFGMQYDIHTDTLNVIKKTAGDDVAGGGAVSSSASVAGASAAGVGNIGKGDARSPPVSSAVPSANTISPTADTAEKR